MVLSAVTSGLFTDTRVKDKASKKRDAVDPAKDQRVRGLLPDLSTNHKPTKVIKKLTEDVAAESQIAVVVSLTPAIEMILAL